LKTTDSINIIQKNIELAKGKKKKKVH